MTKKQLQPPYPILDATYGTTIFMAKENLLKVKNGAIESKYLIDDNIYCLQAERKALKEELRDGIYEGMSCSDKLSEIQCELDKLLEESKNAKKEFSNHLKK